MPLDLVTIPCLSDNYAFVLHNADTGDTTLIDAPEAAPIQEALDARGWTLTEVLLTHHHWDHVDGLPDLRDRYAPRVIGAAADAHRLPPLDLEVTEGSDLTLCGAPAQVIEVPGHTIGHIAVHLPGLLFSADSLMALGCGRLFEGTPAQMWDSLQKLRALPDDTLVCSGHEYTETNLAFALSLDQPAALTARAERIHTARAAGRPTVPSRLDDEKATNPFLRADDPALATALNMDGAAPAEVFAHIRAKRDSW